MQTLLKYSEWINEGIEIDMPEWREGGIVLIRGMILKDGFPRLYAGRISSLWRNASGAIMVKLQPEIYIVLKEGYNYVAKKIMMNQEILGRALGLSSYSLALNAKTGKTPLWEKSIKVVNMERFLNDWGVALDTYTQFKY
jgi:hypothetical protein